jgi:protein O-GlcNAc transferase
MESLSKEQQETISNLVKNQNFAVLEFELERIIQKNNTPFLLNLLGVSKIQKKSANKKDAIEAQRLFKESYEKDKNFKDALLNYTRISIKLMENSAHILKALEMLKEHDEKNKYDPKVTLLLADLNFYLSNANESILNIKKVIENNDATQQNWINFLYGIQYTNLFTQAEYINFCKKFYDKIERFDVKNLHNIILEESPLKLRIGFFSADFRNHSVAKFLEEVLKYLKMENKFEIIAFNNSPVKNEDATTKKLKNIFDEWYEIKDLKDLEAINLIRDNKINILFDLVGFSKGTRPAIFKNRSAPIQISWIGYCNTQGIEEIDYIIADDHLIENEQEKFYEEKIIKLPNIWSTHSPINLDIEINELPCIKNKYFTFGSFNNFIKISEETIELWCKILKNNINSKLILKSSAYDLTENLINKFDKGGADIKNITFLKRDESMIDHLKKYNLIDLCLDTIPYTGVTTNIEAAWMGVPTLTLKGDIFLYKCGASINKNIKLDQFIANNKNEYVNKAGEISKNFQELSNIRKSIRKRLIESPVFDNMDLTKNLSRILVQKWKENKDKK